MQSNEHHQDQLGVEALRLLLVGHDLTAFGGDGACMVTRARVTPVIAEPAGSFGFARVLVTTHAQVARWSGSTGIACKGASSLRTRRTAFNVDALTGGVQGSPPVVCARGQVRCQPY